MNDLDLMEKFRAAVPPPHPQVLADARAAMFLAAAPKPRRRWVRGLAPALAAAVAVAVVVVRPHEPAPDAEAGQVLRLAAAEARREPVLAARPDQFVYVESQVAWAGAAMPADGESVKDAKCIPPVEKNRRIWLSVDGSRDGLLREKAINVKDAADPDGLIMENLPLPVRGSPIPAYLRDLPRTRRSRPEP